MWQNLNQAVCGICGALEFRVVPVTRPVRVAKTREEWTKKAGIRSSNSRQFEFMWTQFTDRSRSMLRNMTEHLCHERSSRKPQPHL